jgi:hypothetical protein
LLKYALEGENISKHSTGLQKSFVKDGLQDKSVARKGRIVFNGSIKRS